MSDYIEIDFLGVETKKSGDAIAMRYEINGSTYIHVVDGGYKDTGISLCNHVIQYYGNPRFIDNVVATHNDGDHARGLVPVLEHFNVGRLWMLRPWMYAGELLRFFPTYGTVERLGARLRAAYSNLAALEDIAVARGIPISEPFQGAQIGAFIVMAPTRKRYLELIVTSDKTPPSLENEVGLGDIFNTLLEKAKSAVSYVTAAWGGEAFPAEDTSNENEMSVVQYAQIAGKKVLLTGDTGRDGLAEVINFAPAVGLALPGIDYFQVPHHGGRRNVTGELLDSIVGPRLATKPDSGHFLAFISSAKEDLDHPREVVVRAMIHRGANLHLTEGKGVRAFSQFAPHREGWISLVPAAYPERYEV